jgi:anti-anti-sigma regulatory factor
MGDVRLEGELNRDNVEEFERKLMSVRVEPGCAITLDLSGLDIEDSFAMASAISALRDLCERAGGLVIRGAPQMLGHNLYRVGLLGGSRRIELLGMRLDEPAGF